MKKISLFIAVLILVSACFKDERNNFMVPDSLGIASLENVVDASVHTGTYSLGITKSGKGQSAARMHIVRDREVYLKELDAYNQAHGTDFEPILGSLIDMDRTEFSFSAEETGGKVVISWDPELVARYIGKGDQYVIPVLILSDSPDVKVNDGRNFLLVHLNRSGVTVNQKKIARVVEKKTVEKDKAGNQPPLQEKVVLDVVIDKPIKGMGITYPVVVDNSLIESYNAQNGTAYVAAPSGLVSLETASCTIPEGGKSTTIQLGVDYSVLLEDGLLPQFPSYLVPLRLATEKSQATLNGKDFQLQGLSYDNLVTYVAFDWKESKKGFDIHRVWGLYSSDKDLAWSKDIAGFTAGSERNVSLDGDFIYVAEANTTKNLWAISLKDPGTYKKLPVGGVKDEGTFYLCCPRIIPNDNADINGGKPVLVVSNMGMGGTDPSLYVYADGIDADPSVIGLTTWASRRLGDTFTWWGSLQDGVLFFKDADSGQGTVTFWMKGKTSGTMYLVGRIAAPAVTGAGGYFPFPDNINAGFGSVRGGDTSWYVTTTKNLATLEGADNAPSLTALDAGWADSAFRCFELAGKRYVAVAKQDNAAAGRLIVLEGEGATPWQNILTGGKTVYTAAIQNESENDGLDTQGSPRSSGNSGMDLDIFQKDTDVYIAVVKQNVGLSLFQVSNDEG